MNTAVLKALIQKNLDGLGENVNAAVELFAWRLFTDILEGTLPTINVAPQPEVRTKGHGVKNLNPGPFRKTEEKCVVCGKPLTYDPKIKSNSKTTCREDDCRRKMNVIRSRAWTLDKTDRSKEAAELRARYKIVSQGAVIPTVDLGRFTCVVCGNEQERKRFGVTKCPKADNSECHRKYSNVIEQKRKLTLKHDTVALQGLYTLYPWAKA